MFGVNIPLSYVCLCDQTAPEKNVVNILYYYHFHYYQLEDEGGKKQMYCRVLDPDCESARNDNKSLMIRIFFHRYHWYDNLQQLGKIICCR